MVHSRPCAHGEYPRDVSAENRPAREPSGNQFNGNLFSRYYASHCKNKFLRMCPLWGLSIPLYASCAQRWGIGLTEIIRSASPLAVVRIGFLECAFCEIEIFYTLRVNAIIFDTPVWPVDSFQVDLRRNRMGIAVAEKRNCRLDSCWGIVRFWWVFGE